MRAKTSHLTMSSPIAFDPHPTLATFPCMRFPLLGRSLFFFLCLRAGVRVFEASESFDDSSPCWEVGVFAPAAGGRTEPGAGSEDVSREVDAGGVFARAAAGRTKPGAGSESRDGSKAGGAGWWYDEITG